MIDWHIYNLQLDSSNTVDLYIASSTSSLFILLSDQTWNWHLFYVLVVTRVGENTAFPTNKKIIVADNEGNNSSIVWVVAAPFFPWHFPSNRQYFPFWSWRNKNVRRKWSNSDDVNCQSGDDRCDKLLLCCCCLQFLRVRMERVWTFMRRYHGCLLRHRFVK